MKSKGRSISESREKGKNHFFVLIRWVPDIVKRILKSIQRGGKLQSATKGTTVLSI